MTLADADIVAFAVSANADAARAFYRDTLGLPLVSDDPYALVFDANGTALRIAKVDAVKPPPYTTLGWHVDDISSAVRALTDRGVRFERYPGMEQDDLGIWTTRGGKVAWFKDPDGNLLSLSQDA